MKFRNSVVVECFTFAVLSVYSKLVSGSKWQVAIIWDHMITHH